MATVKNSQRRTQRAQRSVNQNLLTPSSPSVPPAWDGWLTPEQRVDWQVQGTVLKDCRVVGEAVAGLQENGVKVLENERLKNGLCRLRLARYGKAPDMPELDWGKIRNWQVIRWQDEDVPMHYLYMYWKEAYE